MPWNAKRNRRTGHLFQGRYKAFPVEDEGYYWNLRYGSGRNGGKDPTTAYRRFVKDGLIDPVDPRVDRLRHWELSERFGLSHPDSASDFNRRGAKRLEQSSEAVRNQRAIEKKLKMNPESRA